MTDRRELFVAAVGALLAWALVLWGLGRGFEDWVRRPGAPTAAALQPVPPPPPPAGLPRTVDGEAVVLPAPDLGDVAPAASPGGGAALLVPIAGLSAGDLRDGFSESRPGGRRHEAIDIPAPRGTPVLAVADGRIAKLFTSEPGGLTIYQFDADERVAYYYAHLDGYAPGLAEGALVRRGQPLGRVGSTGNADPEAPHLHFAVLRLGADRAWWRGVPIDPLPLFRVGAAGR